MALFYRKPGGCRFLLALKSCEDAERASWPMGIEDYYSSIIV